MGFTEKQVDEIIEALRKKVPKAKCPLCHSGDWKVAPGFVGLTLQENIKSMQLRAPTVPCAVIACTKCGNIQLLNLQDLGLMHLVEKRANAKKK